MGEFSAGILLYRRRAGEVEVLLIHPGGPFWRKKDAGAWMIPKGGVEEGEAPLAAALREFQEELGTRAEGTPRPLCRIRQKGGKWVEAFALEGDLDADAIVSNEFKIEVPPRSGRFRSYPEVDRAAWMSLPEARRMILPSQSPILDALEASL
jgi:predicted NUDIX family NTP pyrophosphohydrolase